MTAPTLDFENVVFTYGEDGPRQYWEANASGIRWVLQRWPDHQPQYWAAFAIQTGTVRCLNYRDIVPGVDDLVGPLYFETDPGPTLEPQKLMHGVSWLLDRLPNPATLEDPLLALRAVSQMYLPA